MPAKLAALSTVLVSTLLTLGCGGHGGVSITTGLGNANMTFSGEWGAKLAPAISPVSVPIIDFVGTLTASNGTVTGGLTPIPNTVPASCLTPSVTPIPVSGTVGANGNLTVTLPVAGGTATLTATLAADPEAGAAGSYKIVGGACAMPTTAMQIAQYEPLNGTYMGAFNELNASGQSVAGTATTITAVLAQSTTPNASDQYPVTGTVTATGACTASFTLSNSVAWGGSLVAAGSPINYILAADSDPTATTLDSLFTSGSSSPSCPFDSSQIFLGVLSRQ